MVHTNIQIDELHWLMIYRDNIFGSCENFCSSQLMEMRMHPYLKTFCWVHDDFDEAQNLPFKRSMCIVRMNTNGAPTEHQRSTIGAPSEHHRAPPEHQRSTNGAPTEHQRITNRAPTEHQRSTNRAPTEHQRSPDGAPTENRAPTEHRSTNETPTEHKLSTNDVPTEHQRSTNKHNVCLYLYSPSHSP